MATMTRRVIQRMGVVSCGVTLPVGWVNYNKLKPGDVIEAVEEDNIIHIKISKNKGKE